MVPSESSATRRTFPFPSKSTDCAVCGIASQESHFGVVSCRACAAFFRRTVAMQLKYVCRLSNKCQVTSTLRSICRSCRYAKCLKVGMKKIAVQRYADRLEPGISREEAEEHGLHAILDLPTIMTKELGMPSLLRMAESYQTLENSRKILHCRNFDVLNKPNPKVTTYSEANEINVREIGLVAEYVSKSFLELHNFSTELKRTLFRSFLRKFMVLEAGYFGSLKRQRDYFILPSGDYILLTNPETFFCELTAKSQMTYKEAVKMFGDIFDKHRRCVLIPMNELALDEIEFLALVTMVFWDFEEEAKECEEISAKLRKRIIDELIFYLRHIKMVREPAVRVAPLLAVLPQLQRVVNRMQEDMALNHAFDVFDVKETFRRVINCSF